jgi:hypothetical protein
MAELRNPLKLKVVSEEPDNFVKLTDIVYDTEKAVLFTSVFHENDRVWIPKRFLKCCYINTPEWTSEVIIVSKAYLYSQCR